MKNWTISCHKCGNNHAVAHVLPADGTPVIECPCGMVEELDYEQTDSET